MIWEIAATKLKTRSGELAVTVSIGVSRARADSSVDGMLGFADEALYRAKSMGRNRAVDSET